VWDVGSEGLEIVEERVEVIPAAVVIFEKPDFGLMVWG